MNEINARQRTATSTPTAFGATERGHLGSCHCGAVRFAFDADLNKPAGRCNCTICTKISQLGGILKPSEFQLLSDESHLSSYEWGFKTSRRYFCKTCGVHCFGKGNIPELGGDYVSVNYNCIDDVELGNIPVVHWDGRHNNWHAGPRSTPWPIKVPVAMSMA